MEIKLNRLAPLIILVIGAIAYANSFNGSFLLDDKGWLVKNIQEPEITQHIIHSTRPLVGASFFFNYRLSGKNEADYHAFNLFIHLFAGLLLYGILRRTLKFIDTTPAQSSMHILPVFAALLWVIHPLQTESVTYIVQRAESMMGLFYLLTLYSAIRGIQSKQHGMWFAISIFACFLGMLTKPIMVTVPIIVLLYDRTFIAGSCMNALRSRWKLYLGLTATWLILAWLVLSPNESTSTTGLSMNSVTPLSYLAVQPGVILHYLKLIVWPNGLCLDYAWAPISSSLDIVRPAVILLPLIILAIVLTAKKSPIGFCMAWFFITLAPSSSILPIADFAVEHRLYLSLAGPAVIISAGIITIVQLFLTRVKSTLSVGWISSILLSILIATLTYQTIMRYRVYISHEAFCRSITSISPHNFRARTMLIEALMDNNKLDLAEREAHQLLIDAQQVIGSKEKQYSILASRPTLFRQLAYMLHGMTLLHLERLNEALDSLQMALTYKPDDHISQNLLAVTLMGLERYQEALAAAERAIELEPKSSATRTLTGMILIKSGRERDAIILLEQSVAMGSHDAIARLELAWLLATDPSPEFRDGKRALILSREVTQMIGGGNYRTLDAMAAAYAASGNFEDAIKTARKAFLDLKRQTENGTAEATSRGVVHSNLKNIKERLDHYKDGRIWCRPSS